jgi:thiamine-phosphate pyrophosphorylase
MSLTEPSRCLNFRFRGRAGRRDDKLPPLILMTDERRLADPLPVIAALPPGSAVIVRHYGDPGREALARRVVAAARPKGVRVLIAADAALAARIGADGLHLPEAMAARGPGSWRGRRRPGWLVTAAAHSPAALWRATCAGADAALLAPVFPTASHPGRAPLGSLRFALWCRQSPLPVYALGGVTAATARRLQASGAAGFAGIGGFLAAPGAGDACGGE